MAPPRLQSSREATLGVRAEDLSLDRRDDAASFPATVYATEPTPISDLVIDGNSGSAPVALDHPQHALDVILADEDGPTAPAIARRERRPHLLLVAGARLLEGWFPGIEEELRAGGATVSSAHQPAEAQ